tara:strand:+ start:1243 stop:1812 length:570 start_codon:yes stop_codon:yes gene_type:complete
MKLENYRKGFTSFLKLERSLSANSVEAYERDLLKFLNFLEMNGLDPSLEEVNSRMMEDFMAWLFDVGVSARSQSRILSGMKAFYKYLLMEDLISQNPTELIEGPKLGRKLPEVLSIEEIDAIIAAIDLSSTEGERNRAIIETLYSCGLRVSELTNLKMSNILKEEGFLKVTGKGDKERFVPIGKSALRF